MTGTANALGYLFSNQNASSTEALNPSTYQSRGEGPAPSVYAELKGWEFTTRISKIRRGIVASQQQIINFAEFGSPLPPQNTQSAVALNLNNQLL